MFICQLCKTSTAPGEKLVMVATKVRPNGADAPGFQIVQESRACPRCAEETRGVAPEIVAAPSQAAAIEIGPGPL